MSQSLEPIAPSIQGKVVRALVVDDEEDVRELLMEILGDLQISAEGCSNGKEGLDAIRDRAPDLVFCDLRMPVMDGFAFRQALASVRPDLLSRTVFVSGDLLQRSQDQTGALADHITIEKPFEPVDVRAAVAAIVPGWSAER